MAMFFASGPAASATTACGGDICADLLVEEQACPSFKKATSPAGEVCTDKRGAYAECVLNSGADLCKALVTADPKSQQELERLCGKAPP